MAPGGNHIELNLTRCCCRANSVGERQQLVLGNTLFSRIHTIKFLYQTGTDNVWSITVPLAGASDLSAVGEHCSAWSCTLVGVERSPFRAGVQGAEMMRRPLLPQTASLWL